MAEPTIPEKKALAIIGGYFAAIHGLVKELEARGVDGLDPIACAMEDMGDLVMGLVSGVSDAESSATNR